MGRLRSGRHKGKFAGRWSNNKLEWSRVISNDADLGNLSLLDSKGVARAIEAACLAREKAMQATRAAQSAKQCIRLAAEEHNRSPCVGCVESS